MFWYISVASEPLDLGTAVDEVLEERGEQVIYN
jgi:hypothetical protein